MWLYVVKIGKPSIKGYELGELSLIFFKAKIPINAERRRIKRDKYHNSSPRPSRGGSWSLRPREIACVERWDSQTRGCIQVSQRNLHGFDLSLKETRYVVGVLTNWAVHQWHLWRLTRTRQEEERMLYESPHVRRWERETVHQFQTPNSWHLHWNEYRSHPAWSSVEDLRGHHLER